MKKIIILTLWLVFVLGVAVAFAEIKNPDTYVYLSIGEADTLDPGYAYDSASGEILTYVYENLIAYDGANMQAFIPVLATEVPTVENGLIQNNATTYVFPIRPGVKFHNGNDLTPEDVEYSFERNILFDPANGPQWMIIEALFNFQTLDDLVADKVGTPLTEMVDENGNLIHPDDAAKLIEFYQQVIDPVIEVQNGSVVFHLVRPFAPFLYIFPKHAYWSSILDKETCVEWGCWDGNADGWWKYYNVKKESSPLYDKANGTGPFKMTEWDRTQQKTNLDRFDDYWGEKAKIARVIDWGIDEWSTRRAMLEAGDADQIYMPTQYLDQIKDMKDVKIEKGERITVTAFHFNWTVDKTSDFLGSGTLDGNGIPPDFFSDIHCRRAFSYAFDYDTLIEQVLLGYGKRLPSVIPSGMLGYNPNLPMFEFDLAKAEEEFKKAWDGKVWENGFKLTLLFNTGNDVRQTACEMFKENIESLNPKFKIEVQGVQWPNYLDAYKSGKLPAFVIGWIADYPDPHNFIFTYFHSNGVYGGPQGEAYIKFAQENLDPKIEAAIAETDAAKRQTMYEEIQKIAYENALGISFYQPIELYPMRTWVKGWEFNPMQSGETNYNGVYKAE